MSVDLRISPEQAYLQGLRDGLQIAHAVQFGAESKLFPTTEAAVRFGRDEICRIAQQHVDRGALLGIGDRLDAAFAEVSI